MTLPSSVIVHVKNDLIRAETINRINIIAPDEIRGMPFFVADRYIDGDRTNILMSLFTGDVTVFQVDIGNTCLAAVCQWHVQIATR